MTGKIYFGIINLLLELCAKIKVYMRYFLFAWWIYMRSWYGNLKKKGHRCFSPRFNYVENRNFTSGWARNGGELGPGTGRLWQQNKRTYKSTYIFRRCLQIYTKIWSLIPGVFHWFFSFLCRRISGCRLPEIRLRFVAGLSAYVRRFLGVQSNVHRRTSHASGYH